MNFGGVMETVVTSKEFSLEKAREVLKNETIAVIGYGIQGPGQACNLRDNGFNVIVGQRQGKTFDKAVADGWVPGKTLFSIEEAAEKGTILCMLLSDAGQIQVWPTIKKYLTKGKTLYYSHGFAINWSDRTGVVPPEDVDVIMVCALCSAKVADLTARMLFIRMQADTQKRRPSPSVSVSEQAICSRLHSSARLQVTSQVSAVR